MPIASTLAFVKNQLDGIPMPGGVPNMAAYITPPDPNVEATTPTAYVWPTDGHESRNEPGTIPRNTGPGTPAGFKPVNHMVDVFIVYFGADTDPQADSLFPGIVDAAMFALRTCEDSATLQDPYNPNVTTTLYDLGEVMSYQIVISALADQAYNRYDCLLRCGPVMELIQADASRVSRTEGGAMASVQYTGHFPATYPDYVDVSTGKTLVVQPGHSYTVTVAPGRNATLGALPGDGRWGTGFGQAAEEPHEDDSLEELADDPPAAPEPPPAAPAGESEPETIPAAGEPAASPESEA